MSFKRDGDDLSLLNRLKQSRVSELLGSCIPEDEAKLLSNGRLTCLVCSHRPIFDTVNMLAKHRQGKRHLFELNKYIKRNEQLEIRKIKKEQEEHVEKCRKANLATSKSNSLLLGPRDNFSNEEFMPGKRRKILDVPQISFQPSIVSTCEPKKISSSSSSQLRKYIKKIKKKTPLEKTVEKEKSSYSSISNDSKNQVEFSSNTFVERSIPVNKTCSTSQDGSEFSRNLSGWIKDKSGNWIKDPEAEFDTDNEDQE